MEFRIDMSGDTAIVVISGEITFTQNVRFRALMAELGALKFSQARFDIAGVSKLDSTGLGMFLIVNEDAQNKGWKLTISGAKPQVEATLKLAALSDMLVA